MAGRMHQLRRVSLAIVAVVAIVLTVAACATATPSLDQPEITAPAPTATAAG
jgi:hypothetical protein